jgi:hypothetical protein
MPSAISIVTALFPCSALLLLFWAVGYRLIGLHKGYRAVIRIPVKQNKGCMVRQKQSPNGGRIDW